MIQGNDAHAQEALEMYQPVSSSTARSVFLTTPVTSSQRPGNASSNGTDRNSTQDIGTGVLSSVRVPDLAKLAQAERQQGVEDPLAHLQVHATLLGASSEAIRARIGAEALRLAAEVQQLRKELEANRAKDQANERRMEQVLARLDRAEAEHAGASKEREELRAGIISTNATAAWLHVRALAEDRAREQARLEAERAANATQGGAGGGPALPSQLVNASDPAQFNRTMSLVMDTLDRLFLDTADATQDAKRAADAAAGA